MILVLATDAAARIMQLQAQQQLQQQHQLQQANQENFVNNIQPPPALPARQRKKATAKKNIQQQRMQTMQGGQLPKANPRQANSMQDMNTNNIMQTQQMGINPSDNKQMLGGTLEQDLAALTAELEIGKV